jgi:hypothetical protein
MLIHHVLPVIDHLIKHLVTRSGFPTSVGLGLDIWMLHVGDTQIVVLGMVWMIMLVIQELCQSTVLVEGEPVEDRVVNVISIFFPKRVHMHMLSIVRAVVGGRVIIMRYVVCNICY